MGRDGLEGPILPIGPIYDVSTWPHGAQEETTLLCRLAVCVLGATLRGWGLDSQLALPKPELGLRGLRQPRCHSERLQEPREGGEDTPSGQIRGSRPGFTMPLTTSGPQKEPTALSSFSLSHVRDKHFHKDWTTAFQRPPTCQARPPLPRAASSVLSAQCRDPG